MPRQGKGPRLYFRRARRDREGRITHKPRWVIKDGVCETGTGFGLGEGEQAEKALADYIAQKYQPQRSRQRDPTQIPIADALNVYLDDVVPGHARPEETAQRATSLLSWWGDKMLDDVIERNCRRYAGSRSTATAARRELEDLRSAINYHYKQGYCAERMSVWLPEAPPRRERWLTRQEAARLLRALWHAQDPLTGFHRRRHAARFLLVALYTGTRAEAVCSAAVRPTVGHGYVDLDAGLFYRKAPRARQTKKRQPPVPIPPRHLAHMRRWVRLEIAKNFLIEREVGAARKGKPAKLGKPVKSIRSAWNSARGEAGLDEHVVRHTLRHTAATWLMQAGTNPWEAAGYLGMSLDTLLTNYGHHHPDYQREAAANICRPPLIRPQMVRTEQEHAGTIRARKPRKRSA